MSTILPLPPDYDYFRVAEAVIKHLKKNKEIDLRVFIERELGGRRPSPDFVNTAANELRKTGKYRLVEGGIGDMNTFMVSKRKNTLLHDFKVGLITGAVSLLVGWLLLQLDTRETTQKNKQQDEHLIRLSDSLNILEKQLADSTASLRADSSLRVF